MPTHTFTIRGMHCQGCIGRVAAALRGVPGVASAHVTLDPPRAEVHTSQPVPFDTLAGAVKGAGAYTLVEAESLASTDSPATPKPGLYPLILIVLYIAGAAATTTYFRGSASWHVFMNDFMAGFFLVFSFFKLLDLRGFAAAYRMYDLPAGAFAPWAWAYPFVELALGAAYLIRWQPVLTNSITLGLMLVGSAGVLAALSRKCWEIFCSMSMVRLWSPGGLGAKSVPYPFDTGGIQFVQQ